MFKIIHFRVMENKKQSHDWTLGSHEEPLCVIAMTGTLEPRRQPYLCALTSLIHTAGESTDQV